MRSVPSREDQDLRAGAVMTAVVEEGEGEGSPGVGDLVSVSFQPLTPLQLRA